MRLVVYPNYVTRFYTSQVVVGDFWTINSILQWFVRQSVRCWLQFFHIKTYTPWTYQPSWTPFPPQQQNLIEKGLRGGDHFHTYIHIIIYIYIIYIYMYTFYPLFYFLCLFWNNSGFSHRMKFSRFFHKGQELDTGGDGSATGRSLMVEGPYQKLLFLGGVARLGVGWFLSWFQFLEGLNLSFFGKNSPPKRFYVRFLGRFFCSRSDNFQQHCPLISSDQIIIGIGGLNL